MVTAMSQRTIINILGLFIHSAKWAVLLKTKLERLVLLVIVKGGTYVTVIEDDYSRSQGAHVPESHLRHGGCSGLFWRTILPTTLFPLGLSLSHPYGQQRSVREYVLLEA